MVVIVLPKKSTSFTPKWHLALLSLRPAFRRHWKTARRFLINCSGVLAAMIYRDLTQDELDKCRKDTLVSVGDKCTSKALDYLLKFKRKKRKVNKKSGEHVLQIHAMNSSGFDTWIILNNFPCDRRVININKNGKDIVSLRVFNGYIQKNRKPIPQYLIFGCGMTHGNCSLKEFGNPFKVQEEKLKLKLSTMKLMPIIAEMKKMQGYFMLIMMFWVLFVHMLDLVRLRRKLRDLEGKIVCPRLD